MGGLYTHLVPHVQLDIIHNSVNNLETDSETGRTNSTTKAWEEAMLKKVGKATQSGSKTMVNH